MRMQREFFNRNGRCHLCDSPLSGQLCIVHEKVGRVHTFCALKPDRWKAWMEKVGLIPTSVDVEVIKNDSD